MVFSHVTIFPYLYNTTIIPLAWLYAPSTCLCQDNLQHVVNGNILYACNSHSCCCGCQWVLVSIIARQQQCNFIIQKDVYH